VCTRPAVWALALRRVDVCWQALEDQLWSLAILVREQGQGDRRASLPLGRCDRLRRALDVRVYEVLLLHVRTQLIWDGLGDDGDGSDGGGDGCGDLINKNGLEFTSCGGAGHFVSTVSVSGWDWLAAASR